MIEILTDLRRRQNLSLNLFKPNGHRLGSVGRTRLVGIPSLEGACGGAKKSAKTRPKHPAKDGIPVYLPMWLPGSYYLRPIDLDAVGCVRAVIGCGDVFGHRAQVGSLHEV